MYYCGWDGGGTKTEVYAIGPDGQALIDVSFGPLNPNGASTDKVMETIRAAVDCMAGLPGGWAGCAALVIGIAGVSNRRAAETVENAVRACGYAGPLKLLGDQEIALAGAVDGPGAVLIAGTGAICFGKDTMGRPFRVGGYGYLIDDGGSGYAIGRDILSAAVRAIDGRSAPTCLTELTFQALNVSDAQGIVTWLYAPGTGKKEVAALAPLLLTAIEQEDAAACAIARKAGDDLAELAVTAWRKTGMTHGELALTGSILTRYPTIRERVIQAVQSALPNVSIHSPKGSAAQGAARLAMAYGKSLEQ
ncbi:MAG: ATPase [Clostridia bacterium]|nr:ATPase [Clostridia bacterium]